MNQADRYRNLAKARRVRSEKARKREREQARQHRGASKAYRSACDTYYRALRIHGEGSTSEAKAFKKMLDAEVEWFRTFPRD